MILSDVYSRFLNRAILPLLLPLTRSRFPSWARRISERQFWPAADQRAHQLRQLRPLLAHAAAHVPFYRDRIAAAGLIPGAITELEELTRIAMCKKNDILSNFPDRMVAENLRTGDWQYVGTGGTTNRVTVIHDFRKRDMSRAAAAVVMAEDTRYRLGKRQVAIPPDACSAVCGVEGFRQRPVLQYLFDLVHNGSLRDAESISNLRGLVMNNWIERAQVLDPFGPSGTHIDDARLAEYIEAIRQRRPTMLMALPQYLQALSRYVRRTGDAPPRVPVVRPMGALMPPFVKQQVQDALALEVREHYGSRELGGVAFDCRFRQGLHVLTDLFIVEVVDGNGRPVADGELGTVLVTDLHNRAMPMIRYQIGDIARVSHAACPCGRSSPRITIEGRLEDTFVTPGGKVLDAPRGMRILLRATGYRAIPAARACLQVGVALRPFGLRP